MSCHACLQAVFLTQDFLLLWMFNTTKLDIHSSIPALLQGKEILFLKINSLRRHSLELSQYLITCKRHFGGNEKSQTQGSGPKAEGIVCSGSASSPGSAEMSHVEFHVVLPNNNSFLSLLGEHLTTGKSSLAFGMLFLSTSARRQHS